MTEEIKKLNERIEKMTGMHNEIISLKNKVENLQIELIMLKRDNKILREMFQKTVNKLLNRKQWRKGINERKRYTPIEENKTERNRKTNKNIK